MSWMVHNSYESFYRSPFGAVVCQTPLTLKLKIYADRPLDSVIMRTWFYDQDYEYEMQLVDDKPEEKVYQVQITAPQKPGLLWYSFMVIRDCRVYYYGNNLHRLGGKGIIQEQTPPAYQITVYQEGVLTPRWYRESVMYQIFVDRFFNGCENNQVLNPRKGSLIHGTWDDTPLYIKDPDDYSIRRWDFFGGNLLGIIKKLPYLKDLGVSVLYLNPIFEASSNHKYDTGDYHKIDPMYGDNETFRLLCKKASALGISIILDGVFSHTGSDSIYFNQNGSYSSLGAYQSVDSPYYSWFRFYDYPRTYESWWGIGTQPNVNEMDPSYQDFIINNEDSVVQYWLKMGARGWRLDVADELPDEFIKKIRAQMKKMDPEYLLLGEVWEDASNKVSYGKTREYLFGSELDAIMNYPFRRIFLEFLLGKREAIDTHHYLMSLYENYPLPHFYSNMNLIGSHDVPRILTLLGEGQPEEKLRDFEKERFKLTEQQRKIGVLRLKILALIQMTFPGVPAIYYGDEAGMEGYSDPYNRGTYPWGKENKELLAWYKKIINLRNTHDALKNGKWAAVYAHGDVYAYKRWTNEEVLLCIFNRHKNKERKVVLKLNSMPQKVFEDVFTHRKYYVDKDTIELNVSPLTGMVLV